MFGDVGAKTGTGGEWSKKDARRAHGALILPHCVVCVVVCGTSKYSQGGASPGSLSSTLPRGPMQVTGGVPLPVTCKRAVGGPIGKPCALGGKPLSSFPVKPWPLSREALAIIPHSEYCRPASLASHPLPSGWLMGPASDAVGKIGLRLGATAGAAQHTIRKEQYQLHVLIFPAK